MAQVTIIGATGTPITVEEVRPGLFGELGYKYVNQTTQPTTQTKAQTAPTATQTPTTTQSPTPAPQTQQQAPQPQPQPVQQPVQQPAPQPAPQPAQQPTPEQNPYAGASGYTGASIVDFLNAAGQPSDKQSRARLAQQAGIQNYTGTASQNTQLLNSLRSQAKPVQTTGGATGGATPQAGALQQQAMSIQESLQKLMDAGAGDVDINELPQDVPIDQIVTEGLAKYGVQATPDFYKLAQENPIKFVEDLYGSLYRSADLGNIKSQFEDYNDKLQEFEDDIADKMAEINDNPWYSEGKRIREINKLQAKSETKRGNLLSQVKLAQGMYDSGVEQVRFMTQLATNQYNKNIDFQNDLYTKAIERTQELEDLQTKFGMEKELASFKAGLDTDTEDKTVALTNQVLDGFRSLTDLSSTEKTKVLSEMYSKGFGSDTPPPWFKEAIESQFRMSVSPQVLQEEWIKYREDKLRGAESSADDFDNF